MGEAGTSYLLSQLAYQAPTLVVYLIAFGLALICMRRAPTSAMLTIAGAGILVVTAIGVALVQAWLIQKQSVDRGDIRDHAWSMSVVSIAGSCVRAIGLGLLVAAIFVGRRSDRVGGA